MDTKTIIDILTRWQHDSVPKDSEHLDDHDFADLMMERGDRANLAELDEHLARCEQCARIYLGMHEDAQEWQEHWELCQAIAQALRSDDPRQRRRGLNAFGEITELGSSPVLETLMHQALEVEGEETNLVQARQLINRLRSVADAPHLGDAEQGPGDWQRLSERCNNVLEPYAQASLRQLESALRLQLSIFAVNDEPGQFSGGGETLRWRISIERERPLEVAIESAMNVHLGGTLEIIHGTRKHTAPLMEINEAGYVTGAVRISQSEALTAGPDRSVTIRIISGE